MQQYNLLVFDPSGPTTALEKSLRANAGWQKLIKRGAHTLKKPQYQLCFIEPGIACGEELEELKTIHPIHDYFTYYSELNSASAVLSNKTPTEASKPCKTKSILLTNLSVKPLTERILKKEPPAGVKART
ncbi:hypothetical protein BUALT_Bualt01G0088500 [Buddleja alternifolia]|uniref:Uncharacterized protein n=1 Tax=Buddleja alternifolia TaxID=168488 RepID=A0AAV6YDF3_9LAMI|nr:hypothetical protein BUALT_Bualt01G0088500 [Buddleja alternifolia]